MQKSPYQVDLSDRKKYFWCTCGLSAAQPFCDGAHKGSGKKSLHFEIEESRTVFLCGCKQTQNPPYCDGSHARIES